VDETVTWFFKPNCFSNWMNCVIATGIQKTLAGPLCKGKKTDPLVV